jgi:hypothetical protein
MGMNEDMMDRINANISMVVQINFSLNLDIDGLRTKLANMTSVAKSPSQAVTDLHDQNTQPAERVNR